MMYRCTCNYTPIACVCVLQVPVQLQVFPGMVEQVKELIRDLVLPHTLVSHEQQMLAELKVL